MELFPPMPLTSWRGTQADPASVLPGRRQDPAGRQRAAQPLVECALPPHRPGHHHPAHGPDRPWPDLHHRLRLRRPSAAHPHPGRPSGGGPAHRPVGRLLPRPDPPGPGRARDHRGHGPPASLRPARPDRPFADDTEHASYDPAWASRYWQVLSQVNLLLEEFAARFSGKVSPVHHFWHTFDIAHTRFSDRHVDQPPTADAVTREAYAREVIGFGFWFGDDRFPEPAFYAYTAQAGWPGRPAAAASGRLVGSARWQPPGRPALCRRPRQRRPPRQRAGLLRDRLPGRRSTGRLGHRAPVLPRRITDPHLRRHQDLSWKQPDQ